MSAYIEEDTLHASHDVFSVLGDPEDPNSDWSQVRYTEMVGSDYIFLNEEIVAAFQCANALQAFLLDIFLLIGSSPDRAQLLTVKTSDNGKPSFATLNTSWNNGNLEKIILDTHPVDKTDTFVHTLYEHSYRFVSQH